jgi:hypothetical protein
MTGMMDAMYLVRVCGGNAKIESSNGIWKTIFVENSSGVQIGRLSFLDNELKTVKFYKKDYYHEVDESDFIFLRLEVALKTGCLISEKRYIELWNESKKEAFEITEEVRAHRENLPMKKRKRIEGRNPRSLLRARLRNEGLVLQHRKLLSGQEWEFEMARSPVQ